MTITYRIPVQSVVPGMLMFGVPIIRIDKAPHPLIGTLAYRVTQRRSNGEEAHHFPWPFDRALVDITLAGPSPRQLCCQCRWWAPCGHLVEVLQYGWYCDVCRHGQTKEALDHEEIVLWKTREPRFHTDDCPVARRPGVHDGMCLWATPKGRPRSMPHIWKYDSETGQGEYSHPYLPTVDAEELRFLSIGKADPKSDLGLMDALIQCFFNPPSPIPEPTGDRSAWEMARIKKGYQ